MVWVRGREVGEGEKTSVDVPSSGHDDYYSQLHNKWLTQTDRQSDAHTLRQTAMFCAAMDLIRSLFTSVSGKHNSEPILSLDQTCLLAYRPISVRIRSRAVRNRRL